MKTKKNLTVVIVVLLAIALVYTIFAISPMQKEIQFVPKWSFSVMDESLAQKNQASSDANAISEKSFTNQDLIPFVLGTTLGYFSQNGDFVYKYAISQKATCSPAYFVLYGNDSRTFDVKKNDSSALVTINEAGFPYISRNHIFVFGAGGYSCSEYDDAGKLLWHHEGYSPIVNFSSNQTDCVLGFADGEIYVTSSDGTQESSIYPGGSSYPIIYGVDISLDSEKIACVSGYDKQRFILIQKNANHQKIIFHEYLDGQMKEPTLVRFTKDAKFVYYNFQDSLGVVDCTKLVSKHFSVQGKILEISEIPELNVVFVLSKDGENCRITIIEGMTKIVGKYDYTAHETFVASKNDFLFVGKDDTVSCIQIVKK